MIVFSSEGGAIALSSAILWLGYRFSNFDTASLARPGDRIAWVLPFFLLPMFSMVAGIALVMKQRISTEAINPLAGVDDQHQRMRVFKQYLQNTLEQLVLYMIAHLAFAAVIEPGYLKLEPFFAGIFVAGRVLFLVGYLVDPIWRAPGFGLTYYPTLLLGLYVAYRAFLG